MRISLEGVITKRRGTFGFAEATLGNRCIDVFVHAQNFDTHKDRHLARHDGIKVGDIILAEARPPGANRSCYEAIRCSRLSEIGITEGKYGNGEEQQIKRKRRGEDEEYPQCDTTARSSHSRTRTDDGSTWNLSPKMATDGG